MAGTVKLRASRPARAPGTAPGSNRALRRAARHLANQPAGKAALRFLAEHGAFNQCANSLTDGGGVPDAHRRAGGDEDGVAEGLGGTLQGFQGYP